MQEATMTIQILTPVDMDARVIMITIPMKEMYMLPPNEFEEMSRVDSYKFLYKLAQLAERLSKERQ